MLNIAIQGIETSFHEVAAKRFFGNNIGTDKCWTFTELCESLKNNKSDFAVMAIENSIAGSLLQNYGLLQDYDFHIIGEVYLRIEMNLMALVGEKIEDIKIVQSHPIALRQCSQYLNGMKGISLLDKEDTAACAKEIAEKKLHGYAAVANEAAAELFGLEILAKNIETNKKNFTRFVVLGKELKTDKNNNKATLFFNLKHNPGSLAKVLSIFGEYNINLTKIQSVPIIGKPYKYNFHVDVSWEDYQNYLAASKAVKDHTEEFSLLGEYKRGNIDELSK